MDCGGTLLRSRKIRIYPDAESRARLRRYLGLARYWFNQAVELLRSGVKAGHPGTLYKLILKDKQHPSWAFDCPQRVRLHAVSDALKAYRTNGKRVRFRRKKNHKQSIGFDALSLMDGQIWKKEAHRIRFRSRESVPKPCAEGCRVVYEHGRWFLIIPVEVPKLRCREPRLEAVALDPGVRTFCTYYGGVVHGKIGHQAAQRIIRLAFALDRLLSRAAKANAKRRYRMRRAAQRLRWRIKNLVDDLHKKAAVFLCSRFNTIFVPDFSAKHFVERKARKLRNRTVRQLLGLAWGRFVRVLTSVAERYGTKVVRVSEAYTSRTCSYCGTEHRIGSREAWTCRTCGVRHDRDLNGARGIYLAGAAGSGLIRVLVEPGCA